MRKAKLAALLLLLVIPCKIMAFGIPTVDWDRFGWLALKAVTGMDLGQPEWINTLLNFWRNYNNQFKGEIGDDGSDNPGLIKFDHLLNVAIFHNLDGLGPEKYKELFSDALKDFQQIFLNGDYYKGFLTDALKKALKRAVNKDYAKDVMTDSVLNRNTYYANNPRVKATMDIMLAHKKELYGKLILMSREIEARNKTDGADSDRFLALCDYIDQVDKGEDEKGYRAHSTSEVSNQYELYILLAALQNEEIQANRGITEMMRSLLELDIYKQLETIHEN